MGSSLKFASLMQYSTLMKRALKRDPNLENYPHVVGLCKGV